ncbi:hypothetical protein [Streptomyces puniciscabiei]|uniref:hypothetical protein n=1 Tax=Streptomyces puniciscabiei TaxID=164348 RepID=UPI0037A46773
MVGRADRSVEIDAGALVAAVPAAVTAPIGDVSRVNPTVESTAESSGGPSGASSGRPSGESSGRPSGESSGRPSGESSGGPSSAPAVERA